VVTGPFASAEQRASMGLNEARRGPAAAAEPGREFAVAAAAAGHQAIIIAGRADTATSTLPKFGRGVGALGGRAARGRWRGGRRARCGRRDAAAGADGAAGAWLGCPSDAATQRRGGMGNERMTSAPGLLARNLVMLLPQLLATTVKTRA
jgi:hypothetical protein